MSSPLENFRRFSRRYPVATASIAIIVVLGVADYFLWKKTTELDDRAERARQEGEAQQLALGTQPRLEANFTLAREALKTIEGNLISESDLAGNLDYFYQIEKTAGIRLTAISQLSSQPGGADRPFRAIPFALRLTGSYEKLLTYLHALETGPRLLRVRNFSFSQSDPTANQLSLDLTVDVLGQP